MLVGILFKVSAAPFHLWTPDVYEGAPSPVVALMSTAPKAAAFALLLRVVYEMLPTLRPIWSPLLWIVAVLSMTVGNLAALRQENVKRMLAYSSIAHAGYLLAAFAGLGSTGIAAASFYTAAYAAMNVGIFAVVTLVSGYDEKLPMIHDFRGLIYRSPFLGSLLIFFLISLIGIPFTGGFFGKFYSFSAAVGGGAVIACHHRLAQLRCGLGVLPSPGARNRAEARWSERGLCVYFAAGGYRRRCCPLVHRGRNPCAGHCARQSPARGRNRRPHATGSARR